VNLIPTLKDLNTALLTKPKPDQQQMALVIGLFTEKEMDEEAGDTYSVTPWGQFQAAADSLRGHSVFLASSSAEVMHSFKLESKSLPTVLLVGEDRTKFVHFSGDILEQGLAEWVLRHSAPAIGELTLASPGGEIFATQFFSARKIKFILFLATASSSTSADEQQVEAAVKRWKQLAGQFKGRALFAYMRGDAVPDVASYFDASLPGDAPLIVAHEPGHDYRYKSAPRLSLSALAVDSELSETASDDQALKFVVGVLSGSVGKILKSETNASAEATKKLQSGVKSSLVYATGNTVMDLVRNPDKDVLLVVTSSPRLCPACRKLLPTLDLLAKAVQGEPRIIVARIDNSLNDVPTAWTRGQTFPVILWFTAADKQLAIEAAAQDMSKLAEPNPQNYWEAGQSLQELVGFVQRKSSFELASLRVATSEQIATLLGEEAALRDHYEELDRIERRNEGRVVLKSVPLDWLAGEIVFDGKRWHVALGAFLLLWFVMTAGSKAAFGAGTTGATARHRAGTATTGNANNVKDVDGTKDKTT